MVNQLREIYFYREMLKNMVSKELRARYKGSVLGFLWTFLNPLLMLVVYATIFSMVLRIKMEHYAMFLFVGLLPWNFFQGSLQMGASSIISNANLIKKIYFPREILPVALTVSNLFNFIFSLAILIPALFLFGVPLTVNILFFPVILFFHFLFVLGMVLVVSAATVYLRDLVHVISILLMAWFYVTPIIFPLELIPQKYQWILQINPMTPVILAYQNIFFRGKLPDTGGMIYFTILSLVVFLIGMAVFRRLKRNFAEQV